MAFLHSHRVSSGSGKVSVCWREVRKGQRVARLETRTWQLEGGQGVGRLRESVSLRLSSEIKPIMMLLL